MSDEEDLANVMGDLMDTIDRNTRLTEENAKLRRLLEGDITAWAIKIAGAAFAWVECSCGSTGGDHACAAWEVFDEMLMPSPGNNSAPSDEVRAALVEFGRANLGDHGVTQTDDLGDGPQ